MSSFLNYMFHAAPLVFAPMVYMQNGDVFAFFAMLAASAAIGFLVLEYSDGPL